jgi:type I restriction enzyme, S subunit
MTINKSSPWKMSTLGRHFDIQLGKMLNSARNVGEPKPYLGNKAVQWGRIEVAAAGTVPLTKADQERYRLRKNDLLVCEGGEVGRAAIWWDQLPECYYQKALHRLRSKSGFDPRVMMALLEYWAETGRFRHFVTQTSIAHLPRDKFLTMPLPEIPPGEQVRIRDVLEDVDDLILRLERLIEKKQALKQGMMQQLLTGKTRLPECTDEWHPITVGEMCDQHRHAVDPRRHPSREFEHFSLPAYDDGERPVLDRGSEINSIKFAVPPEAVLVSKLNPRIPRVWAPEQIGVNAIASTEFVVLTPKTGVHRSFLKWLMKSIQVAGRMRLLAVGTTGSHARIHPGQIASLAVVVPPQAEQIAISEVLDDVAREVNHLSARLAKTKAVKKGMVQEMLSGRTRLPAAEVTG